MAKAFRGTLQAGIVGYYTNSTDLDDRYQHIRKGIRKTFATGDGDNEADLLYIDAGRSAAAAAVTYELDALASDCWGDTISFAYLRFLLLEVITLTTAYNLTLGGDFVTSSGALPTTVLPGQTLQCIWPIDGIAVTNGVSDTLTIDPGANTVEYNLIIGGND